MFSISSKLNNATQAIKQKVGNVLKDEENELDEAQEQQQTTGHDILAQLGVAPHTELPEDIISPATLRRTQFRLSEPRGYHTKDVDNFMGDLSTTMKYLFNTIHEQDKTIVALGNEFNNLSALLEEQRNAVEYSQITQQFAATGEKDEHYRRVLAENDNLRNRITELEAAILTLNQQIPAEGSHADTESLPQGEVTDEERQAFEEWAAQVTTQFEKLELKNQQLTETLEARGAEIEEAHTVAQQWMTYANELAARLGIDETGTQTTPVEYDEPEAFYTDEEEPPTTYAAPQEPLTLSDDELPSTDASNVWYDQTDTEVDGEEYPYSHEDATSTVDSDDEGDSDDTGSFTTDWYDEDDEEYDTTPAFSGSDVGSPLTPEIDVSDYYVEEHSEEPYDPNSVDLNDFSFTTDTNEATHYDNVDRGAQNFTGDFVELELEVDEHGQGVYRPHSGEVTVTLDDTEEDEDGGVFYDFAEDNDTTTADDGMHFVEEALASPQANEEADNDDDEESGGFDALFEQLEADARSDAPELGENLVRQRTPPPQRAPIQPGGPLTSIPEGADIKDYL